MADKIRVLVVDDSAVIRRAVIQAMQEVDDIEVVAVASDGQEAIAKYKEYRPDVVTMDVIMPKMDGLSALRILVKEHRAPVIMLSGLTKEGANITLRSLDAGAVDFITKPQKGSMLLNFQFLKDELSSKIRTAAKVNFDSNLTLSNEISAARADLDVDKNVKSKSIEGYTKEELNRLSENKVVVIGASTGGPKAIEYILSKMKRKLPAGIVVAQHMPRFFTRFFADRLNRITSLSVDEARNGDIIEEGRVLVIPGEHDVRISRVFMAPQIELEAKEVEDNSPTPSIDTLFYSAAATFGKKTLGVILTGMGRDGYKGLKAIKIMGGRTIAQDERSSLVFGMPKFAINAGVVDSVMSLYQIPGMIENVINNDSN
ncbi:MAG: chemotaxis response regulator protein-glutamate methylesterase [Deltaproteobacteria bacterium]|uniref:Protein-glutamate methylesterase/protein-glutamine glutaminase n=1 Tax=Candidatus Zymogenus saltonus TaxID=2844893 RepID=A0A9D8KDZ9_9DELT|nr:chemotaxis response regulator protein-glutamate methylesterase [Candidatus Zymogenus saltonus]